MLAGDPGHAPSRSVHAHVPPPHATTYTYTTLGILHKEYLLGRPTELSTHVYDNTHQLVLIGS
jgi:hypothetical protein